MEPQPAGINERAFRTIFNHRTMLHAYILALVRDPHRAEDVLSDTVVALAREWDRYDPGRPFAPWARGVARRIALAQLRRDATGPVLRDDAWLDAVGAELDRFGDQAALEERKVLLRRCLERLEPRHRRLIAWRYFENRSTREIARRTGRTPNALYVAFARLHAALQACVERYLHAAGMEG